MLEVLLSVVSLDRFQELQLSELQISPPEISSDRSDRNSQIDVAFIYIHIDCVRTFSDSF